MKIYINASFNIWIIKLNSRLKLCCTMFIQIIQEIAKKIKNLRTLCAVLGSALSSILFLSFYFSTLQEYIKEKLYFLLVEQTDCWCLVCGIIDCFPMWRELFNSVFHPANISCSIVPASLLSQVHSPHTHTHTHTHLTHSPKPILFI